ncbi:MAG: nucleotide pyrophosphohydrolase [Chlamydiales bacterium]|nr:nucleotide pyrophosphohydrolase [Chlamydiales bacterium]
MNPIWQIQQAHKKFTQERNWDRFQSPKNLAMALSVEAAELVEVFMWLTDVQASSLDKEQLQAASEEIADIFIYLLRLSDVLEIDIISEANRKMEKNIQKYPIEQGIALAKALTNKGRESSSCPQS